MSRPLLPGSSRRALALAGIAVLALCAFGGSASAKSLKFHRGGLPSIGQISVKQRDNSSAVVAVPVTFTKAIRGPIGLERAEVTLLVYPRLKRDRADGHPFVKQTRDHMVRGDGTRVEHFRLNRREAKRFFALGKRARGKLLRIDVQHLIRNGKGEPMIHEKDASMTLASSHRARPQGQSGTMILANRTNTSLNTTSTPIMCMYTEGEEGSNLQWFTAEGLAPGGTIEAFVEADGSIFDSSEYQGPTGASAGQYFDWMGIAIDAIAYSFDVELTPFMLAIDLATHCDSMASTFSLVAANAEGAGASSEAFVLTAENCRIECPHEHLISANYALDFQGLGEETNPGIWASKSTEVLLALAGYWHGIPEPEGGKVVQDDGLHFDWREWENEEEDEPEWEVSVGEGSKPAGFSG
jgi:hypothetical protein